MSVDVLPLPFVAQRHLAAKNPKDLKIEIIEIHHTEKVSTESGQQPQVQVAPALPALPVPIIDNAVPTMAPESKDLHRVAANIRSRTALLLGRYRGTKEKVRMVVDRLTLVENRLEKLAAAARSERLESLELMNHGTRFFNSQAYEKHDGLQPLRVARFDTDRNVSFEMPAFFPTTVEDVVELSSDVDKLWELLKYYELRVRLPSSSSRNRGVEVLVDLQSREQVEKFTNACFRTFVRHIGLRWDVVNGFLKA